MVREINQALRKRIPPSWVNLTTNSFGYIWLKSEKCPKITNSYIKSNIFAQSSLVIGPNMIWKSQTKPKTNILLTPLLNAFWKYSVPCLQQAAEAAANHLQNEYLKLLSMLLCFHARDVRSSKVFEGLTGSWLKHLPLLFIIRILQVKTNAMQCNAIVSSRTSRHFEETLHKLNKKCKLSTMYFSSGNFK